MVYRLASQSTNGSKLWPRFQGEYRALTGRTLGKTDEPNKLEPDEFRSVRHPAKVADEPEHLVASDFVADRVHRMVRKAVEDEAISLGRAAEMLRVDLSTMRDIVSSWVE